MAYVNGFAGGLGVSTGFQTNNIFAGAAFGVQTPSATVVGGGAIYGTGVQLYSGWGGFAGEGFSRSGAAFGAFGGEQAYSPLESFGGFSEGAVGASYGSRVPFSTSGAVGALFGSVGSGFPNSFVGTPALQSFVNQSTTGAPPGLPPFLGQSNSAFGGFPGLPPFLGQSNAAFGGFPGLPPYLGQSNAAFGGAPGLPPYLGQSNAAFGGAPGLPPYLGQPNAAFGTGNFIL